MSITPEQLTLLLRRQAWRLNNEEQMQDDVERFLSDRSISFEREKKISLSSRIDFLVEGGIGIECKLKCPKRQIWRQLERYMLCDGVNSLILLTATAMGLPETSNGKPFYYVSAGRGLL